MTRKLTSLASATVSSAIAQAVVMGLLLASCGGSATSPSTPPPVKTPLQIVATAELDIAQAVGQLQTAVINANQQKLVDDATTRTILTVTQKVSQAGIQADAITKGAATLTQGQKVNILMIFNPISQAVQDSLSTGLIPIKDQNTANTIRLLLTTIQGTISGVQIALAGSN